VKLFGNETTEFDALITATIRSMEEFGPDSPEFPKLRTELQALVELKRGSRDRLSPNTALAVAGALAQVGIIVAYERIHVFTSRAQNFMIKPG
jgi:hypothetical protein